MRPAARLTIPRQRDNRTARTGTCGVCRRDDVKVRDGRLGKHEGTGMGTCLGTGQGA